MAEEIAADAKIHPVITALEKADEPTVVIQGYRGTSEDAVVRLYPDLDTSYYVEIPREAVVYLEAEESGEPGPVRAFVRASIDILAVWRRRIRPEDLQDELPPVQPIETFWTCAGQCEGTFAAQAVRILLDEARALAEADPQRQQVYFALIAERKQQAIAGLLACLSICVDQHGAPPFMAVPDPCAPNGFRVVRFSLSGYHAMLVARHLEKPEQE